jgi:hypothetical protein
MVGIIIKVLYKTIHFVYTAKASFEEGFESDLYYLGGEVSKK